MPPIVLLIIAGNQVPVIPFGDIVAKIGAIDPEHKLGIGAKSGVNTGSILIETVERVVEAH